jgi:transcriptional regulator GlxA family with amidase domain
MKGKNLRYLNDTAQQPTSVTRVGFLLLEHFSLPAFTQTLDTFVTANLLRPDLFAARTFGCDTGEVTSDLGLVIRPDARLDAAALPELELLVICGGFRTELKASADLIHLLQSAAEQGVRLAGYGTAPGSSGVPGCCTTTAARSTPNIARPWQKCPKPPMSPANPT